MRIKNEQQEQLKALAARLKFLRAFAEYVFLQGSDDFIEGAMATKDTYMREYFILGRKQKLTRRDLVVLLYKGLFIV